MPDVAALIASPPIRPILDRVLVLQDPEKDKTRSGLYLPEDHPLRWGNTGTVIAVGPGTVTDKGPSVPSEDLKAGDRIYFKRQPASALYPDNREQDTRNHKDLLMLDFENVIGFAEDEN